MADKISKTQRWLDLIAYLIGRRIPVTFGELMEKVPAYAEGWETGDETAQDSTRRMFERDKDDLRALGVPLDTVDIPPDETGEQTAYVLGARDFFLPYLKLVAGRRGVSEAPGGVTRIATVELAPEAASAALDALRFAESVPDFPYAADARSALRKLALDLEPEGATSPAERSVPVLFLDPAGVGDVVTRVRTLSQALLKRKRVAFRYHGIQRGEATDRDVAGYGLMFLHGHWYLVGHDALRRDIRVFRVERMESLKVNGKTPKKADYDIPGNFRLRDHIAREAWSLGDANGEAMRALVLFGFPMSLWAERNARGELVEERPDGSAVRAFDLHDHGPFLRWILSLNGDAVVLHPPELQHALAEVAGRIADRHRGHGHPGGEVPVG